jgi:serine/threonine protein kinase
MSSSKSMNSTLVGTPYFLAPEVCEGRQYSPKSDVWALGCVLYELATLRHAFDGSSLPNVVMKIVQVRPVYATLQLRASPAATWPVVDSS